MSLRKQCLSELLGTYLLVFIGPASVIIAFSSSGLTPFEAQEIVAAVFGCTVAGVMILLGRVSAQINPAVTVAKTAAGRLRQEHILPQILSQLAGAILAGVTLTIVFGRLGSANSLGSTELASAVSPFEGITLEILGTFVLAMSALIAGAFLNAHYQQGILVGTTLFILISFIGPLTGASFNPARSLGPSLFSGYLDNQVIYYAGPILGGLAAGLIFGTVVKPQKGG